MIIIYLLQLFYFVSLYFRGYSIIASGFVFTWQIERPF